MTTTPNESEPEFDRYNLVEKLEEDVKDIEGLNDPHKEGLLGSLSRLPTEAKENVLSALRGNTSARLHDKARIVRIFTSSTFTGIFIIDYFTLFWSNDFSNKVLIDKMTNVQKLCRVFQ